MNYNLIITVFVIFQLLLFTVFLLLRKQRLRTSNKILTIILLSQVVWYFESSLFHWGSSLILYFLHFLYIGESLSYIWGPGVFLYIRYLTRGDSKFNPKDLWYFIPALAHFGFMAYTYHFKPADIKQELIIKNNVLSQTELVVSWCLYCINNVVFTLAAFILLFRYKQKVKSGIAATGIVNIKLITIVLIGFLSICINECMRYLAFLTGKYDLVLPLYTITLINTYIFISILIFGILKKPDFFHLQKIAVKYNSSPLTPSDITFFSEKLKVYMLKEKPYLNDLLSLEDLAKSLNIAPRYLSQVINQVFHQNFFDFINTYRIDHAIEMLSTNKSKKTISEIFYSSGFSSKATFYKAFKKQMHKTPTEFRQLQTFGLK